MTDRAWDLFEREKYQEAREEFLSGPEDSVSLCGVGRTYYRERNYADAKPYFETARGLGSARATFWLAVIYHEGLGVPPNKDEAWRLFSESAKSGFMLAERKRIEIQMEGASFFRKLCLWVGVLRLTLRVVKMNLQDPNDWRLADISRKLSR